VSSLLQLKMVMGLISPKTTAVALCYRYHVHDCRRTALIQKRMLLLISAPRFGRIQYIVAP
jgi:hypothetical protein